MSDETAIKNDLDDIEHSLEEITKSFGEYRDKVQEIEQLCDAFEKAAFDYKLDLLSSLEFLSKLKPVSLDVVNIRIDKYLAVHMYDQDKNEFMD